MTSSMMIASGYALTGCASSPQQSDAAQANVPAPARTPQQQATARLQVEKDHYVADAERRIGEMKNYENNLRTRAASHSAHQSTSQSKIQSKEMRNAADDLDASLKSADISLNDVKSAGAENWIDYRRDVDRQMEHAASIYSNSQSLFQ